MELKSLEIIDFMGIGEGTINFNRPAGITLIQGINNASPTSVSNGSGKSSILEALHWVIFGKTKRGVTGDDVINEESKKGCEVKLYFDDFQIVRTRKPGELRFYEMGAPGIASAELTKGTTKETQALILDTIKMSELTFGKVTYFGQEDLKGFASLSDTELKKVFEQALALTFLSEHHEKAKAYLADIQAKMATKEQDAATLKLQLDETTEKIRILRQAASDLKARKDTEKSRILADIAADQAQVEAIKRQYVETQAQAKQAKAHAQKIQEKLNELTGLEKQLRGKHSLENGKLASANTQTKHAEKCFKETIAQIDKAPNATGQPCPTCKRPFSEADIQNVIDGLRQQLANCKAEYKRLDAQGKTAQATVNQMSAVLAKLEIAIDAERSKVQTGLSEADPVALNKLLTDGERQLDALNGRVESNQRVLVKLDKEDANYVKDIAEAQDWIEDRDMELGFAQKEIAKLQSEFDTAEMLVEVLSNTGMKSYIFDNVTPQLNREINTLAAILDDIEIEVSTVKPLKNGELREKFNIKVDNKHGAGTYNGNSGGEKQKADLAIAMGFNRVFRSMSEGAVNAIFLDEPFESLDKGSSEAVIELCKTFTGIGNVFIITHQDGIKDLITDVITVKKEGKKAIIF